MVRLSVTCTPLKVHVYNDSMQQIQLRYVFYHWPMRCHTGTLFSSTPSAIHDGVNGCKLYIQQQEPVSLSGDYGPPIPREDLQNLPKKT